MSRVNGMRRNRAPSPQTISVLRALATEPARWRYGYDLAAEVRLKSGSLYPILVRLADRGLLEASWEPGPGRLTRRPTSHCPRQGRPAGPRIRCGCRVHVARCVWSRHSHRMRTAPAGPGYPVGYAPIGGSEAAR